MKSNVNFFADDTALFSIVNDPVISANELNHDLKVINQGLISGRWNSTLIPISKRQNYYFPVRKLVQTIHLFYSMVL